MKYRCEYRYSKQFGNQHHLWICIGARGAVHLSITVYHDSKDKDAGLEFHSRTATSDEAPNHDLCWLLKAPCWHDGISLYASEHFLPIWQNHPHDHDRMFTTLELEYYKYFERDVKDGDVRALLYKGGDAQCNPLTTVKWLKRTCESVPTVKRRDVNRAQDPGRVDKY